MKALTEYTLHLADNALILAQRNSEWCGATFSADGRVLFANLQGPGLTLAITGPWAIGTL